MLPRGSNYTLAFIGGGRKCFDPDKDILLPPFTFHPSAVQLHKTLSERDIKFSFQARRRELPRDG